MSSLISVYTIHCIVLTFYASEFWRFFFFFLKNKKNVMKNLNVWKLERKKNEEIKG